MARGATRSLRLLERGRCRLAWLLIVSIIALGCSSGGSGSSGEPPAEITMLNALVIAATAVDAALRVGGLADIGGAIPLFAASASGGGGALKAASSQQPGVALQIAIPPIEIDCEVDGIITISGEIEDPITPTLTIGDRFSVDFTDCENSSGVVLNGEMEFTLVSFSQSVVNCFFDRNQCVAENELTVDAELRDFEQTEGAATITGDGDVTIAIDTLTQQGTRIAQLSGRSLTTGDGTHSGTLRDYDARRTTNLTSGDYEVVASGRLTNNRFEGEVRYETTTPFEGTGTSDPNAGVLRIEGAAAPPADDAAIATIDVVAQPNGVDVDVEIDLDGDDEVDEIEQTTWDDLRALL
jgi:hypothetical protein